MTAHMRRNSNPLRESSRDLAWQDDALCAQVGQEIFYSDDFQDQQDAIEICRHCPVVSQCLEMSIKRPGDICNGIWAGTLPRDRIKVMRTTERRNKPLKWAIEQLAAISKQRRRA